MQYLEMKGNLICLKKKIEKRKFVSKFREMLGRLSDEETESEDELICLEVNTQPGMTKKSLLPELASNIGIPFTELVSCIIRDASVDR